MFEGEAPIKVGIVRDAPLEALCQRVEDGSCEVFSAMQVMISADLLLLEADGRFEAHCHKQLQPRACAHPRLVKLKATLWPMLFVAQ